MGLVTEELPPGDNPRDGLHILKLVHNIREKWKPSLEDEMLEKFPDNWRIPDEEFQQREDLRNKMVFTVDPPESCDLDDAISIEELPNERYVVGIHIADVSYFVEKESALDLEVRGRATSYYPSFARPIHMLPSQLSTQLCSLLPEADRLTISVFITLDQRGNIIDNARIVKSVIRSYVQLSYDDVEKVINSEDRATMPGIRECILMLHSLAKERRRQRLGDGRFAYSHQDDEIEVSHPQAHSMVEEMMLLANLTVAKFLIFKFPQCTMLRRQLSPDKEHLQNWVDDNAEDIKNSVSLMGNRSLIQSTQMPTNANEPGSNHSVTLLKETWNKLQSSVQSDDNVMNKIIDIVCTDQNHPQLATAHSQFYRLMERADYICSGDHPASDKHSHYSLCMSKYTHFTSPIRRYSDLIVHRMLVSAMYGETTPPYTQEEMALLCHHCTAQSLNAKSFEMKTRLLLLALKAKEAPLPILSYVEKVSDTSIQLLFPGRRYILPAKRSVGLQLLKPIEKPVVNEVEGHNLKWKQRIYDKLGHLKSQVPANATQALETARFTVQVPEHQWNEILTGIKTDDIYQIKSAVEVTRNEIERVEREHEEKKGKPTTQAGVSDMVVDEVVSESMNDTQVRHNLFVEFQRGYHQSDVVQIQVHATLQKEVLGPSIQLFNMTPCLDLCTEHRSDPVSCFADVATERPLAIKNISKYKEVWLPILEMMNAHNAVYNDETVVIHGVEIQWQRHFLDDVQKYVYQGSFQLPLNFCEARHIQFSYPRKYSKEEQGNEDIHLDYLCIRYSNLEVPYRIQFQLQELDQKPGVPRPKDHMPHPGQMAFVVHATTTDVQQDKRAGLVIVQFEVTQFSSSFPDVLLGRQADDIPVCTLELIPKTEPDRRLEEAVRQLDKATPLIRDICLLQKPRTTGGADDQVAKQLQAAAKSIRLLEVPGSPLSRPNDSQQTAIRTALDQPFAIIQGPPGTGKTVTGAYLAYFFIKMNKKLPPMGKGPLQVLYCGPSNKSVDVIAEYLKQLNISVVRVYSETIERKEFPIPGAGLTRRKASSGREAQMDERHVDISLHHMIRKSSNSNHEAIKRYDETFRVQGYKASLSDVFDYLRTVKAAEEQELKKYQVVLCTCNAAGSRRIRDLSTVIQCIVDEAGMCNEPETLIPLVNTKPSQVVLIGDHQQLRPIIQERTAQLLGMETSLLEKYKSKAVMLKTQYRMHESICDSPSTMFYHGELETADIINRRRPDPPGMNIWPGGEQRPTVFCHVYGREETLAVKTAEGNEKSRSNPQEVYHVVRIATTLVNRFNVKPENIIVLSQYRLQCSEIEKELHKKGHRQIKVSTVVMSQGSEWDYVIMSTVRSLPRIEIEDKPSTGWKLRHLGFIMDENQMNVALTRAKRGLILVGNQYLLQTHELWNDLLSNYRQYGSVVEARSFPRVR